MQNFDFKNHLGRLQDFRGRDFLCVSEPDGKASRVPGSRTVALAFKGSGLPKPSSKP